MSCKKRIDLKKSKICTGQYNKRITIEYPFNVGTSNSNVNTSREFEEVGKFWAGVKTVSGGQFFQGTNLQEGITTDFYIKFTKSINLEEKIWVRFDNRRFKISNVQNLNEDNLIIRLRAIERGTVLKEANKI